ncbi:hypothetical protein O0L34_g5704 [Tuta absoluta]|nr:hypothetical protein O0L34_g5704 [Tuta absoluta]
MDGQVLILPIRGNGQAKIKITNLHIVVKYDYETKEGHWVVTGYRESFTMDRAQFKFGNLFGGNKQLGDTTNRFANENWHLIMDEIAPPAIRKIIKHCVDVVKMFYAAVPAEQLVLSTRIQSTQ